MMTAKRKMHRFHQVPSDENHLDLAQLLLSLSTKP
jgi:hypothetical protein